MADRVLTLRELNRATLARQMLLERAPLTVQQATGRLVGMQAQSPVAPFIGLWTRLSSFRREDLARAVQDRSIVKVTLMRATLHLCTAEDYVSLRGALQPALAGASGTIARARGQEFDIDKLLAAAREYIAEESRTFAEISSMLSEFAPDADVGAMRYTVRTHLPLVQVPVESGWSYPGNPRFTLAENWLGRPISTEQTPEGVRTLLFRYLAAFGPAAVADMQTWSGLARLKDTVEKLRPELRTYRDEQGRELFDLPGQEEAGMLPGGDAPVPPRFLPEYDNLLLSHSKRTRVVADAYRSRVYLPVLRVASTLLVDGFVRGAWKIEKAKGAATLKIEPFDTISARDRDALAEEGERLVKFVEPEARTYDVRFAD